MSTAVARRAGAAAGAAVARARRYYRRWWWRRRKVINQYFRAKIDYIDTLVWPNTQVAGSAFFRNVNTENIAVQTILEYEEFQRYVKIFSYYRVYAFAVEAVPVSTPNGQNQNTGTMFIGYNPDANDGMSFDDCARSNMSMVLSPTETKRMFRRLQGGTGWYMVNSAERGSFTCRSDYATVFNNGQKWSVRFTVYCLFKNNKA